MRLVIFLMSILASTTLCSQLKSGYEITLKIDGLSDSTVYLAYHLGDKQYLMDTITLDNNGHAVISGKEPVPQGIYMVVLPGRKYFEVLIPNDQVFTVQCSYPDYFTTLRFDGSEENSAFIDYQKEWIKLQGRAAALNDRFQKNRSNSDSAKILHETRLRHEAEMKQYLRDVSARNKGTLLAMLVKSIIPAEIPVFKIPPGTRNPDSLRYFLTYQHNKNHFFDNVDFSDERILRTPILHSKLDAFFKNTVIQLADSINREIDRVIKLSSANYKVFQYVCVYLFNHFRESEIMGHDAVVVKLADEIYLSGKADWTTQEWRENLRKEVDRIRPNLIGVKAQDLVMNTFNNVYVSLHEIKKDYIVMLFWEPDCGHCKEVIPKLKDFYEKNRDKSVEVFAVCTQPDREKWATVIQDNKLGWINAWDPSRITRFDFYYNVTSTPLIYILDREKRIIAKKLPVESVESFINDHRRFSR